MKRKWQFDLLVIYIITLLILSACSSAAPPPVEQEAPETSHASTATQAPTSAPTVSNDQITFTFRNGTCEYSGPTSVTSNKVTLKIAIEEGNEEAMQGVAIVVATLHEGKTIKDLQEWPVTDKPEWADIVNLYEVFPEPLEKEFDLRLPEEPVYFACFYPDAKIGAHGPLVMEEIVPTATFIFRNGTCDYEGPSTVNTDTIKLKLVIEEGNPDAMDGVAVVTATIDDDKTIEDLKTWPSTDPPDWLQVVSLNELFPEPLEKEFNLRLPKGPAYFVCFHPEAKIGAHGPLVVDKDTEAAQAPIPRVAPTASPNPLPVIIDTDMAVDDWMAILYLLNRTDVDVKGITVTGAGEAHCEPGVENALRLVRLAGKSNIPVACGRETPLEDNHTFPEEWRTRVDAFDGQNLPAAENPNTDMDAVALLQSVLTASAEPMTVLTLGPVTNIADLLRADPQAVNLVKMVYVMGGAVDVPGNLAYFINGNETAEWNIYVDPLAAQEMLASGIPVTLVPLDATNQVPLTMDFYDRLEWDHPEAEAAFVYEVLTSSMGMIQSGTYYFWDPLAASILTDESIATITEMDICVETNEGTTSGATQKQAGCPLVRVAIDADPETFEINFIEVLNAP